MSCSAWVLGEFGDDPNRYTDTKFRKNYAGTSPLTVASDANVPCWPVTCATAVFTTPSTTGSLRASSVSPGARLFYDQHRAAGESPPPSPTRPGNRPHRHPARMPTSPCVPYNEHTAAWAHRTPGRRLTPYEPGMSMSGSPMCRGGISDLAARRDQQSRQDWRTACWPPSPTLTARRTGPG